MFSLSVAVFDHDGNLLPKAKVVVIAHNDKKNKALEKSVDSSKGNGSETSQTLPPTTSSDVSSSAVLSPSPMSPFPNLSSPSTTIQMLSLEDEEDQSNVSSPLPPTSNSSLNTTKFSSYKGKERDDDEEEGGEQDEQREGKDSPIAHLFDSKPPVPPPLNHQIGSSSGNFSLEHSSSLEHFGGGIDFDLLDVLSSSNITDQDLVSALGLGDTAMNFASTTTASSAFSSLSTSGSSPPSSTPSSFPSSFLSSSLSTIPIPTQTSTSHSTFTSSATSLSLSPPPLPNLLFSSAIFEGEWCEQEKVFKVMFQLELSQSQQQKQQQQQQRHHPPIRWQYLLIKVSAEDLEAQERTIDLMEDLSSTLKGHRSEHFILGEPGFPFYYRGGVRIPFQPLEDLMAVALDVESGRGLSLPPVSSIPSSSSSFSFSSSSPFSSSSSTYSYLSAPSSGHSLSTGFSYGLRRNVMSLAEELQFTKTMEQDDLIVFGFGSNLTPEEKEQRLLKLASIPGVVEVGQLVNVERKSVAMLTRRFVVKFFPEVERKTVQEIIDSLPGGLVIRRQIQYADNCFEVEASEMKIATYELLSICNRLLELSSFVRYAEPDLNCTLLHDTESGGVSQEDEEHDADDDADDDGDLLLSDDERSPEHSFRHPSSYSSYSSSLRHQSLEISAPTPASTSTSGLGGLKGKEKGKGIGKGKGKGRGDNSDDSEDDWTLGSDESDEEGDPTASRCERMLPVADANFFTSVSPFVSSSSSSSAIPVTTATPSSLSPSPSSLPSLLNAPPEEHTPEKRRKS